MRFPCNKDLNTMTDNDLSGNTTVQPVPRGSKRDWPIVSGQVPPDHRDAVDQLAARRTKAAGARVSRSDVIAEAVAEYLDRRAA